MAHVVYVVRHKRTKMFVSFKEGKKGRQEGMWVHKMEDAASWLPGQAQEASAFCRKHFPMTKPCDLEACEVTLTAEGAKMVEKEHAHG